MRVAKEPERTTLGTCSPGDEVEVGGVSYQVGWQAGDETFVHPWDPSFRWLDLVGRWGGPVSRPATLPVRVVRVRGQVAAQADGSDDVDPLLRHARRGELLRDGPR